MIPGLDESGNLSPVDPFLAGGANPPGGIMEEIGLELDFKTAKYLIKTVSGNTHFTYFNQMVMEEGLAMFYLYDQVLETMSLQMALPVGSIDSILQTE